MCCVNINCIWHGCNRHCDETISETPPQRQTYYLNATSAIKAIIPTFVRSGSAVSKMSCAAKYHLKEPLLRPSETVYDKSLNAISTVRCWPPACFEDSSGDRFSTFFSLVSWWPTSLSPSRTSGIWTWTDNSSAMFERLGLYKQCHILTKITWQTHSLSFHLTLPQNY